MYRRLNLEGMSTAELRAALESEAGVFHVVVMNTVDVYAPQLEPGHAERLLAFERAFWVAVDERAREVSQIVAANLGMRRYQFADQVARLHPAGPALYAAFKALDLTTETSAAALIRQLRLRAETPEEVRHVLGDTLAWPGDAEAEAVRAPILSASSLP